MKPGRIPLPLGRVLRPSRGFGWELADEEGRRVRFLDHFENQYVDAALAVALKPDYEQVLAEHYRLVRELDLLLNGTRAEERASLADLVAQLRTERDKRRALDPLGTAGLLRTLTLEAWAALPAYDQAAEARLRQFRPTNAGEMMDAETGEDDRGPLTTYIRADQALAFISAAAVLRQVLARDLRDQWGRLTVEHPEQEETLRAAVDQFDQEKKS